MDVQEVSDAGSLVTTTDTSINRENTMENCSGLKLPRTGGVPPSVAITSTFTFSFEKNACGSDLDPEKGFRVLVILLGVCLGKKHLEQILP